MTQVLLVRHGESEANASEIWQGRQDGPMTPAGVVQAEAVGRRLSGWNWDVVMSSPLQRARGTAATFGNEVAFDDDFTEVDLGVWDGMPFSQVLNDHGQDLLAILTGSDLQYGGTGETPSQVAGRMWGALDRLADSIGDDGRAVVISHGGAIDSVVAQLFSSQGSIRTVGLAANASVTVLNRRDKRWTLQSFNDTHHLDPPNGVQRRLKDGDSVIAIFRHGQTAANVNGVWQGHTCWGLDDVGHKQAELLANWYGRLDRVYTSPLDRAVQTARRLSTSEPIVVDGLQEIGMGLWEGLTVEEIKSKWPELYSQIFDSRQDLARGETGESWETMSDRVRRTIDRLEIPGGEVTGVVAHGAAIRAYLTSLSGGGWNQASKLETPFNASASHVAFTSRGPLILDYNLAPHLEG